MSSTVRNWKVEERGEKVTTHLLKFSKVLLDPGVQTIFFLRHFVKMGRCREVVCVKRFS